MTWIIRHDRSASEALESGSAQVALVRHDRPSSASEALEPGSAQVALARHDCRPPTFQRHDRLT